MFQQGRQFPSVILKKMVARCYGASDLRDTISNISYRVIRSSYREGCKLSSDVGGLTYFLISFTSSRARGNGERGNILVAPFLSTSSTPLLFSGISTGSSRTINKRTFARATESLTDVTRRHSGSYLSLSPSSRRTHAPTRQFRVLFALGFPEQVLKYLALRMCC